MVDENDKYVGYALYLEFRTPKGLMLANGQLAVPKTEQYIIAQQMYQPRDHSVVPMTVLRRTISDESPKKPWQIRPQRQHTSRLVTTGLEKVQDQKELTRLIAGMLTEATLFLTNTKQTKFQIAGAPVLVQLSKRDRNDLQGENGKPKTPTALIKRVWRARTAAGYPAEFFDTIPGRTF